MDGQSRIRVKDIVWSFYSGVMFVRDAKGRFVKGGPGNPGKRGSAARVCPDNEVTRLRLLTELTDRVQLETIARLELVLQLAARHGADVDTAVALRELADCLTDITLNAYRLLARELRRQVVDGQISLAIVDGS
jgi:hypothetical protein